MSARSSLIDLINAHVRARAVQTAAELRLADFVHAGNDSCEKLAAASGTDERHLRRLMRALVGLGLFHHDRDRFSLTETGSYLRSDKEGSLRNLAVMNAGTFPHWAGMTETLRSGTPGTFAATGRKFFEFVAETPEFAEVFDAAMAEIAGAEIAAMAAAYDFGAHRRIMDVGGGNGEMIITILNAFPHLEGRLLDLQHVVERATPRIAAAGLAERCKISGGSFFDPLPEGADLILLRQVIPDWQEDDALRILANCRGAVSSGGVVIVAGTIVDMAETFTPAMRLDLAMMTYHGAGAFTIDEYCGLLERADLTVKQILQVTPTSGLIVSEPTKK